MADKAYREIKSKANSNMFIQGASSIFSGALMYGVDVAVIGTHYTPMFYNMRRIYGRGALEKSAVLPIITNILPEVMFDVAFDKMLGGVPVVGIYTNMMCAKTLTWRLGILFAMLASRGEDIDSDIVKDCMFVIRNMFPQTNAFKLAQPDMATFGLMVMSVYGNTQDEFAAKINKAKEAFL